MRQSERDYWGRYARALAVIIPLTIASSIEMSRADEPVQTAAGAEMCASAAATSVDSESAETSVSSNGASQTARAAADAATNVAPGVVHLVDVHVVPSEIR